MQRHGTNIEMKHDQGFNSDSQSASQSEDAFLPALWGRFFLFTASSVSFSALCSMMECMMAASLRSDDIFYSGYAVMHMRAVFVLSVHARQLAPWQRKRLREDIVERNMSTAVGMLHALCFTLYTSRFIFGVLFWLLAHGGAFSNFKKYT